MRAPQRCPGGGSPRHGPTHSPPHAGEAARPRLPRAPSRSGTRPRPRRRAAPRSLWRWPRSAAQARGAGPRRRGARRAARAWASRQLLRNVPSTSHGLPSSSPAGDSRAWSTTGISGIGVFEGERSRAGDRDGAGQGGRAVAPTQLTSPRWRPSSVPRARAQQPGVFPIPRGPADGEKRAGAR